jgi:hypothetical protein
MTGPTDERWRGALRALGQLNATSRHLPRSDRTSPTTGENYMAQSPQKPPEPSISDQALQHMTEEQRREEQQRREQAKTEDGSSQNKYPGSGSPS